MNQAALIISKGILQQNQLEGHVALITGAGGGIGYETARSLLWLGAKVVIAEINKEKGKNAETALNKEFGSGSALFCHVDIGNEKSVKKLAHKINSTYSKLDILINNATVAPMGALHQVSINKWDMSYHTNLRGPVLLISQFLPGMLQRNSGVIVLVPSSGAAPYMGAYEIFKTAQVELANTLTAELENTEISVFSLGPGIVKTETAHKAIEEIAPLYGKSVDEFYKMSENLLLSVEAAGAGFGAAVAMAPRYKGLEIGSIQALTDAGIQLQTAVADQRLLLTVADKTRLSELFQRVKNTFTEQIGDWSNRPIFERQWLLRDFKKQMNAAPEHFMEKLTKFEAALVSDELSGKLLETLPLKSIDAYYKHQMDLCKGYEKDPHKVEENLAIMQGWLDAIDSLSHEFDRLLIQN